MSSRSELLARPTREDVKKYREHAVGSVSMSMFGLPPQLFSKEALKDHLIKVSVADKDSQKDETFILSNRLKEYMKHYWQASTQENLDELLQKKLWAGVGKKITELQVKKDEEIELKRSWHRAMSNNEQFANRVRSRESCVLGGACEKEVIIYVDLAEYMVEFAECVGSPSSLEIHAFAGVCIRKSEAGTFYKNTDVFQVDERSYKSMKARGFPFNELLAMHQSGVQSEPFVRRMFGAASGQGKKLGEVVHPSVLRLGELVSVFFRFIKELQNSASPSESLILGTCLSSDAAASIPKYDEELCFFVSPNIYLLFPSLPPPAHLPPPLLTKLTLQLGQDETEWSTFKDFVRACEVDVESSWALYTLYRDTMEKGGRVAAEVACDSVAIFFKKAMNDATMKCEVEQATLIEQEDEDWAYFKHVEAAKRCAHAIMKNEYFPTMRFKFQEISEIDHFGLYLINACAYVLFLKKLPWMSKCGEEILKEMNLKKDEAILELSGQPLTIHLNSVFFVEDQDEDVSNGESLEINYSRSKSVPLSKGVKRKEVDPFDSVFCESYLPDVEDIEDHFRPITGTKKRRSGAKSAPATIDASVFDFLEIEE